MVLTTDLIEIDGLSGTFVAYLPRHSAPAIVVALSDIIGTDFVLTVTTVETGTETYSETHKQDHMALLAALRLDVPR
jgi:hypothetical protein